MIGGGERLAPAALLVAFQQVELAFLVPERGSMNAQQTNKAAGSPVVVEKSADLLEQFRIELGGVGKSVGAGDGGEVVITQLELHSAGVQAGFAQAAANHLRQPQQRGLQLPGIGG